MRVDSGRTGYGSCFMLQKELNSWSRYDLKALVGQLTECVHTAGNLCSLRRQGKLVEYIIRNCPRQLEVLTR